MDRGCKRPSQSAPAAGRRSGWLIALMLCLLLVAAACGADDTAADDPEPDPDPADEATEEEAPDEPAEQETPDEPAPDEPLGPDVTLMLGHGFPPEHVFQRTFLEPWIEEVADATGGSVNIDIHAGGAITEAPPAYENTVAGVTDIAWSLQGYTPGRFPLTEIVELPLLFTSAEEATGALWHLWEEHPEIQAEYDDVQVLAIWTLAPGQLWTRTEQVTTIEDVAGLSLRAPGRVQIDMLAELGANPLTMPAPEIFDALERGVMEGLVIDPVGIAAFGLGDILGYGLDAGFYTSAMFLVMNQASWEQLSPEQQAVLEDMTGREFSLEIARMFDDASAGIIDGISDTVEMHDLGDDLDAWRDATSAVVDDWIAEREGEGHPAQAMYDTLIGHIGITP